MEAATAERPAAAPEAPGAQWEFSEDKSGIPQWHRYLSHEVYGYASPYSIGSNYHWQASRGDYRLSGSADTEQAAKDMADAMLALPIEDFNARVAAALMEDMRALETKILRLCPTMKMLPGYYAGHEAGFSAARALVQESLSKLMTGDA